MMETIRLINDFTGLIHLVGLVVFIIFTVAMVRRLDKIARGVLTCEDHLEVLRYEDYGGRINGLARLVDDAFEYQKTVCNVSRSRAQEDMKKGFEIIVSNMTQHRNEFIRELRKIYKVLKEDKSK